MRPNIRKAVALTMLGGLALGIAACAEDPIAPPADITALLSMEPTHGSTDVAVDSMVTVTFDHAIGVGMEAYAALHEGSLTGPEVEGAWTLSEDRMVLTFAPAQALKSATMYVIHLGGGMMDDQGNHVSLEQHGLGMGGQWATQTMMGGGMGMGGNNQMMGEGWAHPSNGSFGMVFSFTTAG